MRSLTLIASGHGKSRNMLHKLYCHKPILFKSRRSRMIGSKDRIFDAFSFVYVVMRHRQLTLLAASIMTDHDSLLCLETGIFLYITSVPKYNTLYTMLWAMQTTAVSDRMERRAHTCKHSLNNKPWVQVSAPSVVYNSRLDPSSIPH
jgi:hypothetical protein